jgi:hypothetical protein
VEHKHSGAVKLVRPKKDLYALQERWPIKPVSDDIVLDGLCERWPASAGLEFLRGIEQNRVAAKAGIDARLKELHISELKARSVPAPRVT